MKTVLKIALGIVLGFVILIAGCTAFWSITPLISSQELTTKWFQDDKKYLYQNEEYNIEGVVEDIDDTKDSKTLNLKGYDEIHFVKCNISDVSDIENISDGDTVKVKGKIKSNILTVIIVDDCEIKYVK